MQRPERDLPVLNDAPAGFPDVKILTEIRNKNLQAQSSIFHKKSYKHHSYPYRSSCRTSHRVTAECINPDRRAKKPRSKLPHYSLRRRDI